MTERPHNRLVIILGPTASGKTDLSLDLAERFNGEIISADSMQIYKYMNIGTAKLPVSERRGIPHHLIDILDPAEVFSVADYAETATDIICDIQKRQKLPIVVGGTGLYINSLINPYNFSTDAGQDAEYRLELNKLFAVDNGISLHRQLAEIDPVAAAKIHHHDSRRLFRALEVYHTSGQKISELQKNNIQPNNYQLVIIGLTMNREKLYHRIEQRVDLMLAEGLVNEVRGLLASGLSRDAISMQGIGYRQIAGYLNGEYCYEEAVALIKRDTRRFAKRQYTWFKRDNRIFWFDIDHFPEEEMLAEAATALLLKKFGEE